MDLQLSILDQTPIRKDSNATASLEETVELARLADRLGYTRYWISEHHNTITLAGAAPEILLARLGGETKRIRLGSGGIMLPNHSAFKVAENFRLLEALYPGRIDLGIGRAPGGDRATSKLLNPSNTFDPQEYIQQIKDLRDYLSELPSEANFQGRVRAIPSISTEPDIWALTSSGESAYIAAHFGIGLSYAQFINPHGGPEAIKLYKERFKPSATFPLPMTNVGIFIFCSESEEKIERMKKLMNYRLLSFEKGNYDQIFTYDDIKDYQFTSAEQGRIAFHEQRYFMGTPGQMKDYLTKLAIDFDTNEIVLATFSETKEDRLESYRLIADVLLPKL